MRIFIDDGSTNIKMLWEQDGETFTHISPNSFKRGWSATFGSGKPFNYTVDDEKYSFDLITPDALPTNNIDWQYSPLNSIAVHHALLTSGLEPQDVEIVVTLPLTEFYDEDAQYRLDNIERKKKSLLRDVKLNKGVVFNITKVTVRPESIPAGISLCDELKPSHSVLIIDLGGTTLDISMVAGQMTSVSRIYGDPKLGVSLVTDAVKLALARANTDTSSYNVDQIIINRHDEEYLTDNIPGSVSIPRGLLEFSIGSEAFWTTQYMYPPEKNTEIIVYCKAGSRGILAAVSLMQLGYTNVKNLEGGYDAFNPHQDPNAKPKSSGSCGG